MLEIGRKCFEMFYVSAAENLATVLRRNLYLTLDVRCCGFGGKAGYFFSVDSIVY